MPDRLKNGCCYCSAFMLFPDGLRCRKCVEEYNFNDEKEYDKWLEEKPMFIENKKGEENDKNSKVEW